MNESRRPCACRSIGLLPAEEWDLVQLPGAIRECFAATDTTCVHGVPLDLGCRWCPHRLVRPSQSVWQRLRERVVGP